MPSRILLGILHLLSGPRNTSSLPWEPGLCGPHRGPPGPLASCWVWPMVGTSRRSEGGRRERLGRFISVLFWLQHPICLSTRLQAPSGKPVLCPPWVQFSWGSGSTNSLPHPWSPRLVTPAAVASLWGP